MVAGDPFGMEEDNLGKKQICPSPDGYMDDKENICAGNDLVVPKETPMLPRRSGRKAKGFNLRKSLAWNNAFFSEEGVLDPMELSTLTGSVSKMSGTSLSMNKGGMSPLMRFNHSGERSKPAFHDLEEKMCSKGSAKSLVKGAKRSKIISKLEVSIHGEPDMDVVSERISLGKDTVPLSPILSSQKRVANTSRTNPASKIPKFVHAKTSLHLGSRSAMMSTNSSKCNQSVARVNTAESTGLIRGFSPDTEKGVDSSSSSAKHSDGFKKDMVEKASDTSKMNHNSSFQRKIHGSIISSGSRKLSSSLKKNDHQSCGDPPAGPTPAHVKPSGLRMPSPTMGFFSQGKVSPSYSGQSQRTIQPVISKNPPPRKVTSEKLIGESWPISAATKQKPTMCTLATKSNSVLVVSSGSRAIPAPNCAKPSIAALARYPDVNSKLRMMPLHELDREGLTSSGNSNCPTNGVSSLPVEAGEGRTVNPSLESNLSEDTHDSNLLSENSGEHGIPCSKFLTKLHYACKLRECNLKQQECDSVGSNFVKIPEVEDSKDGHYPVMIEDKHSIGNSICELQFGFTTKRADHDTSMDDESLLRLNTEQKDGSNVPSCSLNLELSSSQGTGIPIQALIPETSYQTGISVQSEGAVIPRLQEREHSDAVKSDAVPMKNQINAVPFSDEWLAAVESFGEEILELKTGPVQNSPPEKALPEPGPWSPVKRKAQDVRPFDCTKYSKNLSASETQ